MDLEPHKQRQPSEKQIRLLGRMLFYALIDIRGLARDGKSEQAFDLADAFHNLPVYMFSQSFDWSIFRQFLEEYQERYPPPDELSPYNYLAALDRIERGEEVID